MRMPRDAYTFLYVRQSIVHTFRFPSLVERAHIPRESISACFSASSPFFPFFHHLILVLLRASCLLPRASHLATRASALRYSTTYQLARPLPPPPSPRLTSPFPHPLPRSLQFSLPPLPLLPPPFPPPRSSWPFASLSSLPPTRLSLFTWPDPLPLSISAAPSSTSILYCIALVVLAIRLW